ncbi:hypothetical protein [Methylobacterium sp. WL1]|uniref:hypothetical protein n=2 Tax=unclassified Methylobacterium TaxID=2615210 RepID=UPI0011C20058|nr:hypothetical protein [Methylobacterium sp. WL1]QEE38663.1 hypothetical protein FVA80_06400 [Methylobacterium sp. WL1]
MPASTRLPRPVRAALLLAGLAGAAQAEDAPSIAWPEPGGRATISRAFNGSPITVGVSSRTGGAIDSLTWGGTQFINAHDHGRELQSASSYDGYGECLNPTEAGSDSDGTGPRSTTLLTELKRGPDTLQTRSQMAYWIEPGRVTGSCPKGPGPHAGPRSDDVLAKTVTLGAAGVANAIAYRATYITAQPHESATFEAATAYMPPDFTAFWNLDSATGQSAPLSAGPGEQGVPVILATPDGSRAMGVYSPALPPADRSECRLWPVQLRDPAGPGQRHREVELRLPGEQRPRGGAQLHLLRGGRHPAGRPRGPRRPAGGPDRRAGGSLPANPAPAPWQPLLRRRRGRRAWRSMSGRSRAAMPAK